MEDKIKRWSIVANGAETFCLHYYNDDNEKVVTSTLVSIDFQNNQAKTEHKLFNLGSRRVQNDLPSQGI